MAERGIKDVVIGIIMLVFLIGTFGYIITDFDNGFSNNEGYGNSITNTYHNVSTNYKESDIELQQNLLNVSSFSTPGTSDVDTRGYSQVAIMTKNSPDTIKTFMDQATKYLLLHKVVTTTLILLILTIIAIAFIKVFIERKL